MSSKLERSDKKKNFSGGALMLVEMDENDLSNQKNVDAVKKNHT